MNYGKVEERSSSRSRSPNTARRAATSAILTDILSRSDRAPTSRTADARPGKSILIVPERVGHPDRTHLRSIESPVVEQRLGTLPWRETPVADMCHSADRDRPYGLVP